MTLGGRIKKLRKSLDLTQKKFAEQIGTSQNSIANYEIDHRSPSAAALNNICKTFNVSEEWLRTGEGEMLLPTPATIVDEVVKEYGLDDLDKQIILEYIKLPEAERQVVKHYIQNLTNSISPPKTFEEEARAEAERYYQELVKEKKQGSQALSVKESGVG